MKAAMVLAVALNQIHSLLERNRWRTSEIFATALFYDRHKDTRSWWSGGEDDDADDDHADSFDEGDDDDAEGQEVESMVKTVAVTLQDMRMLTCL
ncbi:hypothetical protein AK812_SmicGene25806 [Symbiodinium microadriaticum]|uniref:Uncharacterized protein n=1 Tax=Symbiodinium microadriaticum TaxID=2951 RepID=A0A1Q9DB52_SYMMI|nr:hypothetical protein AK812_SmicGene25806 [Symbiodinium microadriaticum]